MHIAVIDDLKENLELYQSLLSPAFKVSAFQNPSDFLDQLKITKPDLVLMDLHMPTINGFEVYEKFKDGHPDLPVVLLSGDGSEASILRGLELGIDDYIVKPVSLNILIARMKNKIKKTMKKSDADASLSMAELTLHLDIQTADINNQKIPLTPTEFKLLHLLMKYPNKIFTREYIASYLWPDVHVQNQNLDTHLSNLRRKIKPFSDRIKTIKSRGYILRF